MELLFDRWRIRARRKIRSGIEKIQIRSGFYHLHYRAILGHRGLEGTRLTPGWKTFSQTVFYNFWTKTDKKVKICYKYLGQILSIFWLIYIWQECKDYYLCSDFCLCLFTRNVFAEKVWDYVTNQGGGLRMPWPIRNPSQRRWRLHPTMLITWITKWAYFRIIIVVVIVIIWLFSPVDHQMNLL